MDLDELTAVTMDMEFWAQTSKKGCGTATGLTSFRSASTWSDDGMLAKGAGHLLSICRFKVVEPLGIDNRTLS